MKPSLCQYIDMSWLIIFILFVIIMATMHYQQEKRITELERKVDFIIMYRDIE